MKISRFIAVSTLSVVIAGFSYQTSGYAQRLQLPFVTAQAQNDSATIQAKAEMMIEYFFKKDFQQIPSFATPDLRNDLSEERMQRLWDRVNTKQWQF